MDIRLERMLTKHREKLVEHLSKVEPPSGDDGTNPFITFWAMVDMGAELHGQIKDNDSYYASGRCGGCETCGPTPHSLPYDAGEQYMNYMRKLFPLMDEHNRRVEEEANAEAETDAESPF